MRRELTKAELSAIIDQIGGVTTVLARVVNLLTTNNLPSVLIHGETVQNRYLPAMLDWAEKMEMDAKIEIRAVKAGRKPRARDDKEENIRRVAKERAAKAAAAAAAVATAATAAASARKKSAK